MFEYYHDKLNEIWEDQNRKSKNLGGQNHKSKNLGAMAL